MSSSVEVFDDEDNSDNAGLPDSAELSDDRNVERDNHDLVSLSVDDDLVSRSDNGDLVSRSDDDDLVSGSDEEEQLSIGASASASESTRNLPQRAWPLSDDNTTEEDKRWEDWDEDQRRALEKSHTRTMGTLEESTRTSVYHRSHSIHGVRPKAPKNQIHPSTKVQFLQAEMEAKKRKSYYEHPSKKNNKAFFTRNCFLLSAIGMLCFCAFMALTILVPPGGLVGESFISREGTFRGIDANATKSTFIDVSLGQESIVHAFVSDTNRNTEIMDTEENEETNFLYRYLKKMAFFIGHFVMPSTDDDITTVAVDSSIDLNLLKDITLPNYEGLYSLVKEPSFGTQAVLWETKRSGANNLKDILTFCLKLVLASDMAENHQVDQLLKIYSTQDNIGHFVNANTETLNGLKRAQEIGVVESELVHVISTPYIVEASSLFNHIKRSGRIFVLLRHPVDQAHSDFLFRKTLPEGDLERVPDDMTIAQFIESDRLIPNQLTRTLLNVTDENIALTDIHILGAQKVLQERVLVGLLESFDASVHRFANYFGWNIRDSVCLSNFETARDNRESHVILSNSTLEWEMLADRNYADMKLYEFGQSLFERQKTLATSNI
mmetsp:Transcript_11338/g.12981  ORF Transcript_11338/g.12981 Transcript_11338/m.12981 type:complete len:607 (-) Transcript_11338:67-1887(-)